MFLLLQFHSKFFRSPLLLLFKFSVSRRHMFGLSAPMLGNTFHIEDFLLSHSRVLEREVCYALVQIFVPHCHELLDHVFRVCLLLVCVGVVEQLAELVVVVLDLAPDVSPVLHFAAKLNGSIFEDGASAVELLQELAGVDALTIEQGRQEGRTGLGVFAPHFGIVLGLTELLRLLFGIGVGCRVNREQVPRQIAMGVRPPRPSRAFRDAAAILRQMLHRFGPPYDSCKFKRAFFGLCLAFLCR